MSAYKGEVIATFEGVELRRLTSQERRGGPQYYCLVGVTHWNPPHFFLKQAEDAERAARLLRAAHTELATTAGEPAVTETQRRLHVCQVNTLGGPEWQCEAGQLDQPVGCERHRDHHWCPTCQGYYGVRHDGIHDGEDAHPEGNWWGRGQCACRPCKQASGRA